MFPSEEGGRQEEQLQPQQVEVKASAIVQQAAGNSVAEVEAQLAAASTSSREGVAACEASVKALELQLRTEAAQGKPAEVVQADRAALRRIKGRLQELERQALLSGSNQAQRTDAATSAEAQRTANVTERMRQQEDKLQETRKVLQETEEVASGIMFDLSKQKETINSTADKVAHVNSDLGYSKQLLKSMNSWWTFSSIQDNKKS